MDLKDKRLIERGFPCHQVGAETQRERGASSALPPLYFLHVWWARRPLTPSRAAVLASLLPAETDPELFLRMLGIERVQALVNGEPWTLTGDLLSKVTRRFEPKGALYGNPHPVGLTASSCENRLGAGSLVKALESGFEELKVDSFVLKRLANEEETRAANREIISKMLDRDPSLKEDPVLLRWQEESRPIPKPWPKEGECLPVRRVMGDPDWAKRRMLLTKVHSVRFPGDPYGYDRAFVLKAALPCSEMIVLDPTSGGGSIACEALRLGFNVIANELNPVAVTILHATLIFPVQYCTELVEEIKLWGNKLIDLMGREVEDLYPDGGALPREESSELFVNTSENRELYLQLNSEHVVDYLFVRQVRCPSCGGEAPLLNTCWLSKEASDQWGIRVITDGKARDGTVRFEPYRVHKGRGPRGEDPNTATVNRGTGQCVHCRQAISGEEIKAQARGESPLGRWTDRLYCVVAVRFEPKLDKNGQPERYTSGPNKGEIKTRKVRFFRAPNERDLQALHEAEKRLLEKWDYWDSQGLIPTEAIPEGNDMRPIHYGMSRWCDLFTPRQLLGHLTLIENLNRLKPQILAELGEEKGRAVITYLQFAIDKGLDYNSKQTRWHYSRGVMINTFGRHDFSLKWTFGEMIFTGPNSGAAWGLSQVIDAYRGIAELLEPVHKALGQDSKVPVKIFHGTAAHMPHIPDKSVDLVCMDPPYYNNVQYAELSDYFYVWQRRTLKDLYPDIFRRRLTNKQDEAVANPARDGSAKEAAEMYRKMMGEIFAECRRVLKDEGLMTLMFTHKSQEAWESLTRSLIESGWTITSSVPVESESAASLHQRDMAAAASSIFISCRKRNSVGSVPSLWTGIGGLGVQRKVSEAVGEALREFEPLGLSPVDEMVACYGRALHVLSQNWPVMDGDQPVGPTRAMLEASRVVAENQVSRITAGRMSVKDLDTETGMALTLFGIYGLSSFSFDDALNLSKSLNVSLAMKTAGYRIEPQMIGINQEGDGGAGRSRGAREEERGYAAPLVRSGSKLRLARPEERDPRRLDTPQTDWDILQGLIMAYRRGDSPVAREYLMRNAGEKIHRILDLVEIWGAEVGEEKLSREARTLLFDMKSTSPGGKS